MNLIETNGYLTWLSQADARIQVTDPNVQIWQNALANATTHEVREATLEFTRINDGVMVTPAAIRKMAFSIRERAVAAQTALTATPRQVNYDAYVKRSHRPEYHAAFLEGQRQGNASRAYKTTLRETGSREQARAAGQAARDAVRE